MNPNGGGERFNSEAAPRFEAPPVGADKNEKSKTTEVQPGSPESSPSRQAAPPIPALPTDLPADQSQAVAASISTDNDQPVPTVVGAAAEDKDRIERQWIDKAKAIISTSKDDPFTQKNEMNKVKAEYISKRFNKRIKADDAAVAS